MDWVFRLEYEAYLVFWVHFAVCFFQNKDFSDFLTPWEAWYTVFEWELNITFQNKQTFRHVERIVIAFNFFPRVDNDLKKLYLGICLVPFLHKHQNLLASVLDLEFTIYKTDQLPLS